MTQKDFREISSSYSDRGEDVNIAIGLRPSGIIHLGNMATLSLAGVLGQDIGPHLSKVNLTVCDLDLPDAADWSIKENGYVRYFNSLPDKTGEYNSLYDKSIARIEEFTEGLQNHLDVSYDIKKLSDVQKDLGFRVGLRRVLEREGIMQYVLRRVPKEHSLVFPLCNDCGTSSPFPAKYNEGNLKTQCTNPECSVKDYEMDVLDTDNDLAVHFFIDPLRDKTVKPYADVHVFGGDYREPHDAGPRPNNEQFDLFETREDGKVSKIEKIMSIVNIATEGNLPDILIGPTFFARDGTKMSKSKNNGLSIDHLKNHFGEDYSKRIADFMSYVSKEDLKVLDYRTIERELFNKK
ncbi:hypothetical protein GF378_01935 [Candidatus Pacearchaeota archaeon]|nr:hypothetical protein [Candidatus Pacearchaeota archaeon]